MKIHSTSNNSPLLPIPPEILGHIVKNISMKDVDAFRMTNRYFKDFIDLNPLILKHIQISESWNQRWSSLGYNHMSWELKSSTEGPRSPPRDVSLEQIHQTLHKIEKFKPDPNTRPITLQKAMQQSLIAPWENDSILYAVNSKASSITSSIWQLDLKSQTIPCQPDWIETLEGDIQSMAVRNHIQHGWILHVLTPTMLMTMNPYISSNQVKIYCIKLKMRIESMAVSSCGGFLLFVEAPSDVGIRSRRLHIYTHILRPLHCIPLNTISDPVKKICITYDASQILLMKDATQRSDMHILDCIPSQLQNLLKNHRAQTHHKTVSNLLK